MMITLAALTFDPLGFVQIQALPSSDTRSITRRVNRVATLDGGVSVNDRGFTPGDQSMTIRWRTRDRDNEAAVQRMLKLYARVQLSTDAGVFLAALQSYNNDGSESTLSVLILAQISE